MPVGNARMLHTQQIHYLRKTIQYNDSGVSGGVLVGTLPVGAVITQILVNIATAFNAGTTNTLTIGTTPTGTQIATGGDTAAGATGVKTPTTGLPLTFSADTDVYAAYAQAGTAATAGTATIVISFAVNNDK